MTKPATPLPEFDLDWLYARVKKDDDGCLIWDGYTTDAGQPQARINYKFFLVRRAVWAQVHGKQPDPKLWIGARCKKHGCVHPDCVVGRSRGKALQGRSMPIAVRAKISAAKCKNSKVSPESVWAMRVEPGTLAEAAERHGVDQSYVSQIRRNKSRRDYSNPFAGLGAR